MYFKLSGRKSNEPDSFNGAPLKTFSDLQIQFDNHIRHQKTKEYDGFFCALISERRAWPLARLIIENETPIDLFKTATECN